MDYHRNQLREERRRRILADSSSTIKLADRQEQSELGRGDTRAEEDNRPYTAGALEDCQARITDLIPKKPITLAAWFLLAASMIAGVHFLALRIVDWVPILDAEALVSLDPARTGSLAGWLSSMLLAWGAMGSILIYTIRRHKADDFRGRYRIWLSLSLMLMLASLDAATSLHTLFAATCSHLTGTTLFAGGMGWWMLLYLLGGGYFALKIMLDVRASRASFITLALALLMYGASLGLLMEGEANTLSPELALARSGLTVSAHLFTLLGLGLYARYVFLDAQGQIKAKEPRKKSAAASPSLAAEAGSKKQKVNVAEKITPSKEKKKKAPLRQSDLEGSHEKKKASEQESSSTPKKSTSKKEQRSEPTKKKSPTVKKSSYVNATSTLDDEYDESPDGNRLSKSQRRKLRKQKRNQQRKAA